uniref:Invasion-associated protein B n=1 Tax=Bartonella henselae TaxID=38323 RepID=UPI00017EE997|nr:Chain A, Invasion-associated protein B [Bartonella henselae]3DTD_B Chain B, Invasion-associated protein B [Bartonella henselae]3DTD_C Chain C, Invasion-associated protein B [Bartonella henselae]3DTD_D Chain D, Invasion-associated protein B [Bartonella henselae]3DTD_E Chain E, Invasion-associated protein B [Bartonella henselae]3DTD_F Chain F, Invasion-associated protein B [Bartonella henselae]3DTD_G Chain G, Invasion-associated protein B [Bartonella henselae]3DTD_H Chain H, Invasion-associ
MSLSNSKSTTTKDTVATLPNGASSLTETYGLWSINCGIQEGKKVCFMHRQEVNDQNRVVVAMSVVLNADGVVSGNLTVPFGILVSKPVRLQVDEGKAVIETGIRTCVPAGCIVPIVFDKNYVAALRAGKHLKLAMTIAAPGEPPLNDLFVQLNGFSNALNRLIALQKEGHHHHHH